jgi:hypothetical protein
MDELNTRIIQVMDAYNHSKSSFSGELGISLPLLTHIYNGRNKPGIDILQKILLKFTKVSPDWLLTGKGEMYRAEDKKPDHTGIFRRLDALALAIQGQQQVNNTITNYHRILADELLHLGELTEMTRQSSEKLKGLEIEIEKIRTSLTGEVKP